MVVKFVGLFLMFSFRDSFSRIHSKARRGLIRFETMKLTEQVIKNFRSAKTFRENTLRINSVDFSVQGDTLISSSDDESIVIYDCQSGM